MTSDAYFAVPPAPLALLEITAAFREKRLTRWQARLGELEAVGCTGKMVRNSV